MEYEFTAKIEQLPGKIRWSVLYFPKSALECFGTKGKVPVKITVDGHPFEHTLLASRQGHYLVYNEFIRRAVGKELGDNVLVRLVKDDLPRVFKAPDYLTAILQEKGVLAAFLKQPDYLKREQVNTLEIAKKADTKERRIEKLIKVLGAKDAEKNADPLR